MKLSFFTLCFIILFQLNSVAQNIPPKCNSVYAKENILDTDNWLKDFNSKMNTLPFSLAPIPNILPKGNKQDIQSKPIYSLAIIKPDLEKYPYLKWDADVTKKYSIIQIAPVINTQK